MKTAILAPFALALGTLALASCGSRQQPAAEADSAASGGLSITDGRLVLPAVKGNPGAVYFTVHNGSADQATIETVEVKGAGSAMMHQTTMTNGEASMEALAQADVPPKADLVFAPGGRHVMAMDLAPTLTPGGKTDVTVTFAGGAAKTFPARILAAGDAR